MQLYGILTSPRTLIDAMEKVQRFAIRMCPKNWSLDHKQLYHQSKLPPLSERWSTAKLSHIFKTVNDLCDFPDAPVQWREIDYSNMQANSLQLCSLQAESLNTIFPFSSKLLLSGTHSHTLFSHLPLLAHSSQVSDRLLRSLLVFVWLHAHFSYIQLFMLTSVFFSNKNY